MDAREDVNNLYAKTAEEARKLAANPKTRTCETVRKQTK
jgi:hypothetical protein